MAYKFASISAWADTEWCDAVLFAGWKVRTQTDDGAFGRKRTIARALGKEGGDRVLRCIGGPACVAKNRFGFPVELPLSWAAFVHAMTPLSDERNVSHG